MTALDKTQIPVSIVTVEALAGWALALLYDLYNAREYQEVQGQDVTNLITAQAGRAGDGTERLIYRVSTQLHPEWRTSGNVIWADTLPIADVPIPARYLV